MLSMTGFGKGEADCEGKFAFRTEISSVNRKQLELRANFPPELAALENNARKIIGSYISRGAIQLRVALTTLDRSALNGTVDTAFLEELITADRAVRRKLGLDDSIDVEALMRIPDVVATRSPDLDRPELVTAFEKSLHNAFERFQSMRTTEGDALKRDLSARADHLEALLAKLEELVSGLPEQARKRLLTRIANAGLPVAADDPALLREALFYADKSDVTEEITRLHSHFGQLRKFLNAAGPSGRSLDFLAQEFFREITTLGNKAAGPEVSPLVVEFKSELEKMREQIQNVE